MFVVWSILTPSMATTYHLRFIGWLVLYKVFKRVVISFLPKGHTHEDIDQFFSRLAVYLRSHNSYSRLGLKLAIRSSYYVDDMKIAQRPIVECLDNISNFSDWVSPAYQSNRMTNITDYGQYEVKVCPVKDVPVVRAKKYCGVRGENWSGFDERKEDHVIFNKALPPATLTNVPAAQRRNIPTRAEVKVQLASLHEVGRERKISAVHMADLEKMVTSCADRQDLPFTSGRCFELKKIKVPVNQDPVDDDDMKGVDEVWDEKRPEDVDDAGDSSEDCDEFEIGNLIVIKATPTAVQVCFY